MKRIVTLLMALTMVFGAASLASAAVEFSASGHMHLNFAVMDNHQTFNDMAKEDNFFAGQRFRPKLTMKADGVTAVVEVQQHQAIWGNNFNTYQNANPNIDFRLRQAYLDFKLPSTPVSLKVGYQDLALPSIWGHPVFRTRVGGVVATIPFSDQIALSALWARPEHYTADVALAESHNSTDMFGALLPMNFGSVSATPYIVYARAGVPADNMNDALIVGGVNLNIMPNDALSLKFDGIVTSYSSDNAARDYGTGFMLATDIGYKMGWGTPGFFAWYATGADDKGEGFLFKYATDGFGPTTWGFGGTNSFGYQDQVSNSGVGTWAVGLKIADMSFVDSLKHTVRLAYGMGTSDKVLAGTVYPFAGNVPVWTEKDSFIEGNFDSTWSIYENLAAVVELGALLPDWGNNHGNRADDMSLKAQLTLRFTF